MRGLGIGNQKLEIADQIFEKLDTTGKLKEDQIKFQAKKETSARFSDMSHFRTLFLLNTKIFTVREE